MLRFHCVFVLSTPDWTTVESRGWNLVWGNVSTHLHSWKQGRTSNCVQKKIQTDETLWRWMYLILKYQMKPADLFGNNLLYPSLNQMHVNSWWTQTRSTDPSNWLTTTGKWQQWMSSNHILLIQRGFKTALSCCVKTVWPVTVIGRWSGKDGFIYLWLIKESKGVETALNVGLEKIISPGVLFVLIKVTLSATITTGKSSLLLLSLTE